MGPTSSSKIFLCKNIFYFRQKTKALDCQETFTGKIAIEIPTNDVDTQKLLTIHLWEVNDTLVWPIA
jgi:hypothetical protein